MPPEHPDLPSAVPGCVVHLTQHRDGWSVTVTRVGGAASFHGHEPDPRLALALAKAVAAAEGADLLVLTAVGRDVAHEFVPAARVARYELPPRPPRG